jgi:tryptophan synthase, alpha subunit
MSLRIKKVFENKSKKLVTFTTGGDPDLKISIKILETIINNKVDIIEIGMPFSDPMADGPTIQLSSNRSIKNGTKLNDIFFIVREIRKKNKEIPIILMGYYNVIFYYGINKFVNECKNNGVDGLIIVDLQPEEDGELFKELKKNNISLIRLITPTTNESRLKLILSNASGFLYYVTITGITGQNSADLNELERSIKFIKSHSNLPIIAGFGIKDSNDVKEICNITEVP